MVGTYTPQDFNTSLDFLQLQTYCVNSNVADSACSGTAYLSGVKANIGTVGLGAAVKHGDCKGQKDGQHSVTGLMDWAQKENKATGKWFLIEL